MRVLGRATLDVGNVSSRVPLPIISSTVTALVTNLGPDPAFVVLGPSSVTAVVGKGKCVLAGASAAIDLGPNTHLAAVTSYNAFEARLNIALGREG
jgi:hypothetical protein